MRIRPATPDDETTLRALWNDSNRELGFTPYAQSAFASELLTDHVALIAEDDKAIVGTVYAAMPSDEHGFVFGLYVIPAARRQGIARALMRAVAGELHQQQRRFVVLSVDTANDPACAMYERLGFVDQARVLLADVAQLLS